MNRDFVALWTKEYGNAPDNNEGDQWQACQVLGDAITRAGSADIEPLKAALLTVNMDSIKGHIAMRECDHQVIQPGFMVKVVKQAGSAVPGAEVLATFPGEKTAPACRQMTYTD